MSLPKQVEICCPVCVESQTVTVWNSINATIDPRLKKLLLKGEINILKCNKCREETLIANDLLYHDLDNKIMIWLKYPDEEDSVHLEKAARTLIEGLTHDYQLRIVTSLKQLIEKILIFDDQLDDRVIEVLKLIIWQQHGGEEFPPDDCLFYQNVKTKVFKGNELGFVLFDKSGSETGCFVPWQGYLDACTKTHELLAGSSEKKASWLVIDGDYAIELAAEILGPGPLKKEPLPREKKPDGTIMWRDEHGKVKEVQLPPERLDELLKSPGAKRLYRILIKDPMVTEILEDYWELTPEQVEKFVDDEDTAYSVVVYKKGEKEQFLTAKHLWDLAPGWKE